MESLTEKIEDLARDELLYVLASLHEDTLKQFPELGKFFGSSQLKDINLNFSKKDANEIRDELIFLAQANSAHSKKIGEILAKEKEPTDDLIIASEGVSHEMIVAATYLISLIINKVFVHLQNNQIAKNPTIEKGVDENGKDKLIVRDYSKQTNIDLKPLLDLAKSKKAPAEIIKSLEKYLEDQNGTE